MANSIKHFLFALITAFCVTTQALGQTAGLMPPGVLQLFDNNGNPLSAGTIDTYIAGTSTRKTTWKNSGETLTNTNPIVLDAGGKAIVYGQGTYRFVVKDRNANLIWDAVTAPSGGGGSTASTGDGDAVGTVKPWSGISAPNQYVFAYGQEINRTTYSVFLTAITYTTTVACSSGSNILTAIADTTQLSVGTAVELLCVSAGTTITAKTSSTVTLSNPSTVTLNTSATFFPFGAGNGTTTFNVPDLRSYVIAGRSNMGGTTNSLLTSTYFGSDPAAQGAKGGAQSGSQTIASANIPNFALDISGLAVSAGTLGFTGNPHTHGIPNVSTLNSGVSGSGSAFLQASTNGTPNAAGTFFANSGNVNNTTAGGTITGAPGVGGSVITGTAGTAMTINRLQPTITMNYIVKVTADTNSAIATGVTSIQSMVGDIACGSGLICTGNTMSVTGLGVSAAANTVLANATSDAANMLAFGMPSCSTSNSALIWTSGIGFGCNSINNVSPAALTRTNDTNVTVTLGGTPATAVLQATSITVGWTGTLAAARLNSSVVQAITNDTNIQGSISAQTLTLAWASTLSPARGGCGTSLAATGGTSQVLKQTSVGGNCTVAQLAASDLSNGTTGSGAVVLAAAPAITGNGTATTQSLGDNSTRLATTAYVDGSIAASVAGVSLLNGQTGVVVIATNPSVRLTLTSGVPVTQTDVTGATAIYILPVNTAVTGIYDGSNDVFRAVPSSTTLTLTAGNHVASTAYDVWEAWVSSAYVVGTGPAWTNSGAGTSTRGTGAGTTEFVIRNGRPTNANIITLKNGASTYSNIPVSQANLLGSFIVTSVAGETEDSIANRNVCNIYNAAVRPLRRVDTTNTWTYSTAAFRQANGSAANQVQAFNCIAGRPVFIQAIGLTNNSISTNQTVASGVGVNSTSANSAAILSPGTPNNNQYLSSSAIYEDFPPALGLNQYVWLERGAGADTQTWVGDIGVSFIQSGMYGRTLQ